MTEHNDTSANPHPAGLEQRIRDKAYELWEKEGRPAWQQERHWDEAKAIVENETGKWRDQPGPVFGPFGNRPTAISVSGNGHELRPDRWRTDERQA